jgi:hypothetical protein
MDNFIKKIFKGEEIDELVHSQFVKFSKGEFPERAMIRAKNSSGKYTISTTSEYAKDIIMFLAENLGDKTTKVTGALISALDLDGFKYDERRMAMGVRKYMLYDQQMTGKEIIGLCNRIEKAFFALSFSTEDTNLEIQAKSPKSAKGVSSEKKGDAKAKIDFIKIKTTNENLVKNLIFDEEAKEFGKIEIKHKILVSDIVFPAGEKDFAKIRELAKRKGKILRELDIDGKAIRKEAEFEA